MHQLNASRPFFAGDTQVSRLGTGQMRPTSWSFTKREGAWDVVMRGGGRCATLRLEDEAFKALLEAAHIAFVVARDEGRFEDFS